MNITKITGMLILTITGLYSHAQSGFVSSGGDYNGTGGTVNASVGQVSYSSNAAANGNSNEGIQQPIEIYRYTGISEEEVFSISLYPNPSVDFVYIEQDNARENLTAKIMDSQGKQVKLVQIQDELTQINIESLSNATYIISIYSDTLLLTSHQFIKK